MVAIYLGSFFGLIGIASSILISSIITCLIDIKYLSRELDAKSSSYLLVQAKYIAFTFPPLLLILVLKEHAERISNHYIEIGLEEIERFH